MKHKLLLASITLALGLGTAIALARPTRSAPPAIPFDELSLTFEINATDVDSGVLFFSDTPESVQHLIVQNPDGRTIYQATSNDPLGLGLTEVLWETAEPDIQSALRSYPEGPYTVTAQTFDGKVLRGIANVSHKVLQPPNITEPQDGDRLDIDDVVISWVFDPKAIYYWLEVEADTLELNYNYTMQLPPGTSTFHMPAALLVPSTSYKIGIGAVGGNGNSIVSVVEFDILP